MIQNMIGGLQGIVDHVMVGRYVGFTGNAAIGVGWPVRVPVVTLDEYCATHRVMPDWMLVDAEGADLAVLQGAAALLRDTPVRVVVEMHASLWDPRHTTPASFEAFLHSCGRTAVPITGQTNPFADYGTVSPIPHP